MDSRTILLLIALLIGAAVLLVAWSLPHLQSEVPREDREYMDPLPGPLRMAWFIVRFLEFHVCQFIPADALEKTHRKLALTGVGYLAIRKITNIDV